MLKIGSGALMTLKNFILISFASIALVSCDTTKKSGDDDKGNIPLGKAARSCIPEAELVAPNILQGIKILPGDADAKAVVLVFNKSQICTGTAIADNVILTAAHCVASGNASTIRVFFHPSITCESGFNPKKHAMGVANVFVHEDYNPKVEADQTRGDIALLVLFEKIPEGYPVYEIARPGDVVDDPLLLYGYGKTASNQRGAGILRKAVVAKNQYNVDVANESVRIEQKNLPGICQGDSGGPSFVMINGELKILGVSSYVHGATDDVCNGLGYQVLVSSHSNWIEGKLKESSANR